MIGDVIDIVKNVFSSYAIFLPNVLGCFRSKQRENEEIPAKKRPFSTVYNI